MNPDDFVITVDSNTDSYYSYGSDTYDVDMSGINLTDITLTDKLMGFQCYKIYNLLIL